MVEPRNVWLHSDQPCITDPLEDLGAEATAQTVADIARTNAGPLTIGVFGDWGSGKTTVLERAAELSSKNESTIVLRLNPWEHEREADPLDSLVVELFGEIRTQSKASEAGGKKNMLDGIASALSSLYGRALAGIALKPVLTVGGGILLSQADPLGHLALATAGMIPEALPIEAPPSRTRIREQLEKAAKDSECKVVVFLDDLDRCQPDRALAVLEAVKHLLWAKGFVFVLALDPTVLESYLERLHTKDFGVAEAGIGKRYLEKLVQTQVPVAHRDERLFNDYVEKVVGKVIDDNEWLPKGAKSYGLRALLIASARRQPRRAGRRNQE